MAGSQLLSYIQENKGKFEKSALVETLTRAGWPIADIDAAFAAVDKIPTPPSAAASKQEVPPPAKPAPVASQTAHAPNQATQTQPAALDENSAFLAEMARHRKAAAQASEEMVGSMKVSIQQGQGSASNSITGKLIEWGIAKDEQQANIITIGVLIAVAGITMWYFL